MAGTGRSVQAVPTAAHKEKRRAVSVFVLSEVRLYCDGLAQLLSARNDVQLVGAASPGVPALARIAEAKPSVVLVDSIAVRHSDVVQQVAGAAPGTRVVAFALGDDSTEVLACAEAGVDGYVASEASVDELVRIVLNLDSAEQSCSPRIATLM